MHLLDRRPPRPLFNLEASGNSLQIPMLVPPPEARFPESEPLLHVNFAERARQNATINGLPAGRVNRLGLRATTLMRLFNMPRKSLPAPLSFCLPLLPSTPPVAIPITVNKVSVALVVLPVRLFTAHQLADSIQLV